MTELHLPWLELAVGVLLFGAYCIRFFDGAASARSFALGVLGLGMVLNVGAWVDFEQMHVLAAHDRWDFFHAWLGVDLLTIDEFSAPLLLLANLHSFLTVFSTLRTKISRLPLAGILASQAIVQAILSTEVAWLLIALMALSIVPPAMDLVHRRKPLRVFLIHMGVHIGTLVIGWRLIEMFPDSGAFHWIGGGMLVLSVLIRSGVAPVHCWVPDLFEHASFATAILFVTPMLGAYAAVRLLMPVAPDWGMQGMALASVLTAVYAAGLALVQREPRRFYCYLFLSHASLVLVGLETISPEALAGGLCVWFSASLSLTAFGLTLRAVESRLGRLSLSDYHGLYDHMPNLAVLFLITGLASVGFPGTIGFVSTELLMDGVIHTYPTFGLALVVASAINGISILKVYFRLFTGARHSSTISLQSRWPEKLAVLTLVLLMIGGGLYPQPFLVSRTRAAEHLIQERQAVLHPSNQIPPAVEPTEEDSDTDREDDPTSQQRSGSGLGHARSDFRRFRFLLRNRLGVARSIRQRGPHRNRDSLDPAGLQPVTSSSIPTIVSQPHESYPIWKSVRPPLATRHRLHPKAI